MTSKKLTRSTSTLISIVAFVAILSAVNFFLFRHPVRADLTQNKMFTISDATKTMLKNMTDDVNVTLYRSEDLPPTLLPEYRFTKEYLEEMASLSGGKLNVLVETPKEDPETEDALARKGVQKQQVNIMQKDEYTATAIYYHLLVQHLDKTKVITFPQSAILEYNIASALLEVTQREKPIVAFVSNDPEFEFQQILGFLRDRMGMGDRYDIRDLALDKDQSLSIPKDCKTLVLVKPKDFSETDLYAIDQFVMNGGTLVVFGEAVDFMNPNPMAMYQPAPPPNIIPLLDAYGIKVNSDLVEDYKSHATRQVPAGRQGMFTIMTEVAYPQWVIAQRDNFDTNNPALAHQQVLIFPFPNSLEFRAELPEGVQKIELISTTDKAKTQPRPPFNLQPPKDNKTPDDTKKYMLAGAVTGPLESYFKGKDKPAKAEEEDKQNDPLKAMEKAEDENAPKLDQAKNGRVIVISTAEFLSPDILQSVGGQVAQQSLMFMENMVDWLSLGTDLIAIRTKPVQQYPLQANLEDGQKAKAKFLGRFAIPILIVFAGVAWWLIRRRRLSTLAQVYAR